MTKTPPAAPSPAAPVPAVLRRRRGARRWRLGALLCLAACGGCRLLADEFTWLDRAAPAALRTPDAPRPALAADR